MKRLCGVFQHQSFEKGAILTSCGYGGQYDKRRQFLRSGDGTVDSTAVRSQNDFEQIDRIFRHGEAIVEHAAYTRSNICDIEAVGARHAHFDIVRTRRNASEREGFRVLYLSLLSEDCQEARH